MIKAAIYDELTGEIVRSIQADISQISTQTQEGEGLLQGEGQDDTHYVDIGLTIPEIKTKTAAPIVVDKTAMLADTIDIATLSAIPTGSKVYVNRKEQGVAGDEVVEFSTDTVGEHTILITHVKYLDYEVTINAN